MPDDPVFRPDPEGVRVHCGDAEFLFRDTTAAVLQPLYDETVRAARDHFDARWRSAAGPTLTEPEYRTLTSEIALHWLYFYLMNRLRPAVKTADWDHPASRRIIRRHVAGRFGEGTPDAHRAAAGLCGLTMPEFEKWLEGDRWFTELF